ncbi:MAG: tryptophan-rich sensory protein [Lachnospiraceae bacterium]|nr:tryptophan-rich sensory protein [Lachnospiraceae bacterium]
MKTRNLKIINTLAFAVMIAVNALANLLHLGGNTTGQVSEAYPNLFTPAPITFAIWGIIYLFMAAFVLYQWEIFDKGEISGEIRERIGYWFSVSCLLNIAWIFFWHFNILLASVICILALQVVIIIILVKFHPMEGNKRAFRMVNAGFDIYFGWIIVATIVNSIVLAVQMDWNLFLSQQVMWTEIIILIGSAIGTGIVLITKKWLMGVAMIWAYAGVLFQYYITGMAKNYLSLIVTLFISSALIMGAIFFVNFGEEYEEDVVA